MYLVPYLAAGPQGAPCATCKLPSNPSTLRQRYKTETFHPHLVLSKVDQQKHVFKLLVDALQSLFDCSPILIVGVQSVPKTCNKSLRTFLVEVRTIEFNVFIVANIGYWGCFWL